MKTFKINNIIITIFFLIALFIPLMFVNKTSGKISKAENRTLASFPATVTLKTILNKKFTRQFENWFNDHLGLRNKFVKLNTRLQFYVFGRMTKKDVLRGKENWLYYVTPDIIKDYQQLNLPSENELIEWGQSLEKMNNYFKRKKIPFIMMLNLDKKTIYAENYPDTIFKVGNISRTELITQYIKNKTSIDFVNPKLELMNAKNEATVYSPRVDSSHWNNQGAFIGYLVLMNTIKKYYPNIRILSLADFDISSYERKDKIYNAISISEVDYAFKIKEKTGFKAKEVSDELGLENNNLYFRYFNTNKKLPRLLIIGDSYVHIFLLENLAQSFSEVTFIHWSNLNRIDEITEKFTPDMVVYEVVERVLNLAPIKMNTLFAHSI